MADGPTVGGYPKIGVVASVDLPALAQKMPGETVVFELIAADEAQRLLRADAAAMREARRSLAAGSVSA